MDDLGRLSRLLLLEAPVSLLLSLKHTKVVLYSVICHVSVIDHPCDSHSRVAVIAPKERSRSFVDVGAVPVPQKRISQQSAYPNFLT
jgi:hypothetical protein